MKTLFKINFPSKFNFGSDRPDFKKGSAKEKLGALQFSGVRWKYIFSTRFECSFRCCAVGDQSRGDHCVGWRFRFLDFLKKVIVYVFFKNTTFLFIFLVHRRCSAPGQWRIKDAEKNIFIVIKFWRLWNCLSLPICSPIIKIGTVNIFIITLLLSQKLFVAATINSYCHNSWLLPW